LTGRPATRAQPSRSARRQAAPFVPPVMATMPDAPGERRIGFLVPSLSVSEIESLEP
jgi:hypothetical protein